jgi:uncharacterized membrane protein (UPF0136 family)
LTIDSSLDEIALIKRISGATIQNLSLSAFNITGNDFVGAIVSKLTGTENYLSNIHLNQSQIRGHEFVGGLIGNILGASLFFENITNNSEIIGEDDRLGGIIGLISSNSQVTLSSITNHGTVSGIIGDNDEVGGIIGEIHNSTVHLIQVTNTADVSGDDDRIGGIIGSIDSSSHVTLNTVMNTGDVTATGLRGNKADEVGGIIGYISSSSNVILSEITNTGDVTGDEDRIGGIIGYIRELSNVTLTSITNSGDVTGVDEVGGIIGKVFKSAAHITTAVNHGNIESQTEVGGLVGAVSGSSDVNIILSMNYGSVTSLEDDDVFSRTGGLVGDGGDNSTDYLRIFQSANFGTVSGHLEGIGGLIGEINEGSVEIIESFNEGEVHLAILNSNPGIAGGIVGYIFHNNSNVTLSSVYNSGLISASSVNNEKTFIGGLIGRVGNDPEISIIHAYNVGLTTSSANNYEMGAVMGSNNSDNIALTSVFYLDSIASGISFGAMTGTIAGTALAQTAVQLVDVNTFFNESWSITSHGLGSGSIWISGYNGIETYPWLQWRNAPSNDQVSNVYFIRTPQDLKAIENELAGNYIILNDIDLSSYGTLNRSFIDATFTGNLSGQGFTISGLSITATTGNIGLFKQLGTNAAIENITLSGFHIESDQALSDIGLLAGSINNATDITIENIHAKNSTVEGKSRTGGLIGFIYFGNDVVIRNIKNDFVVTGNDYHVGGLIGEIHTSNVIIENVLQRGLVNGIGNQVGGIIGLIRNNDQTNVTMSGIAQESNVEGKGNDAGGIIGQVRSGKLHLSNSYNQGFVINRTSSNSTHNGTAGIIGGSGGSSSVTIFIQNVYQIGQITKTGTSRIGSIMGELNNISSIVTLSGVFALSGSSIDNVTIGAINDTASLSGQVTVASTAQMTAFSTFDDAGWDIAQYPTVNKIWSIEYNGQDTYPWLTWTSKPSNP